MTLRPPIPDPAPVVADLARVAAVRATGLLDTGAEEAFDRLVRLATRITGAPAAFLALVDGDHDFYKSHTGFGERLAGSRRIEGRTFCHHAIAADQPLVIDDVSSDPGYASVVTTCAACSTRRRTSPRWRTRACSDRRSCSRRWRTTCAARCRSSTRR